jgi:Putative transposase of IS4/5 family (DUF4096)
VPDVRRLLLAMAAPKREEREFRLGWSLWRRAHQAVAKRCHEATHAAKRGSSPEERFPDLTQGTRPLPRRAPASMPMAARLTEEEWELVKPLMPPQKPPTGRPRSDQRRMLAGVLWVLGTGAGWRDLPEEEFGPWRTVYGHYRRWREEGL